MDENELGEHGVLDEPDVLGEHVASLHEAISQIQTPGAKRLMDQLLFSLP